MIKDLYLTLRGSGLSVASMNFSTFIRKNQGSSLRYDNFTQICSTSSYIVTYIFPDVEPFGCSASRSRISCIPFYACLAMVKQLIIENLAGDRLAKILLCV